MRFDNLQEWLEWQASLHPKTIELGLARSLKVWQSLGAPRIANTLVSVAGTNGKGSSIAFLENIYLSAGYKVGAYTSPHLFDYTERLRIGGEQIDEHRFCKAFAAIDSARGDTSLTYFEFGTLAVFLIMSEYHLELALLEVGLGGRLDAVNIVDAEVALVTSIALDHTDWLGDTREAIGFEKAGIFRQDKAVICADPNPPASLIQEANNKSCALLVYTTDFSIVEKEDNSWDWCAQSKRFNRDIFSLPYPFLRGKSQLRNAAASIAVVNVLSHKYPCSSVNIRDGLLSARMPGRFQMEQGDISLIYDVAHNPESANTLAENLKAYPASGKSVAIFSALNDKDIEGIVVALAESFDRWYLFEIDDKRAMPLPKLVDALRAQKLHGLDSACVDIESACVQAMQSLVCGDRLVVFGSFMVVAAAMKIIRVEHLDKPDEPNAGI